MYVYIRSEKYLWTVGFYAPDGKWYPESDHGTTGSAAKRVNYLNGELQPGQVVVDESALDMLQDKAGLSR